MGKQNLSDQLETNLYFNGFFTFQGADGGSGGIRLTGLTAINWREVSPEIWEIIFFHGEALQPNKIILNRENFFRLVNYLA